MILHKIFTNLNNGGTRLSFQELRNGIYPCAFSRMINNLNRQNARWRELYGRINEECKDIEFLYRLCAMKKYVEYDGVDFKVNDYKNSVNKLIDHLAEEAYDFDIEEVEKYQRSLKQFINLLDISKQYFKKTFLLEGLFVVWEKTGICPEKFTDKICRKIAGDKTIKKTQQGGTVSMTNMNKRWKRIYEILSDDVG